jgi:mono/diheme cytochrome c family protein
MSRAGGFNLGGRLPALAVAALLLLVLPGVGLTAALRVQSQAERVARGQYLFDAAGCFGCHTDEAHGGQRLAGGRALDTPFGTFYPPNITPDPIYGIGNWSDAAFIRALRRGVRADGSSLFPAFPYTSFTLMDDGDILALKAYLMTQKPVAQPNRPHELRDPFGWRVLMPAWNLMYLQVGPLDTNPHQSAQWNRGQYLVRALGHCGECHTPRDWAGGLDQSRALAGNPGGAGGEAAPNLTPDVETGLGTWSEADLLVLLEMGLKPDGDVVGGTMAEVVRNSTSQLTLADRKAIVAYVLSLPPIASPRR